MNLSHKELSQLEQKGISIQKLKAQLKVFEEGMPFMHLDSAATIGNGILKFNDEDSNKAIRYFDTNKGTLELLKFVPASGAATRMFKSLFAFIKGFNLGEETINAYINRTEDVTLRLFLIGIEKLPFYEKVLGQAKTYFPNFDNENQDCKNYYFIKTLLDKDKFNYGAFPKGLIPFHVKDGELLTAFEEHLIESYLYASNSNKAKLHFTISKTHYEKFKAEIKRIISKVERNTGVAFDISMSFQKEETDTIAVTLQNEIFKLNNGDMLFRPAGHGALIENLNDVDADVIFVKNIDNVVVSQYQEEMAQQKKLLAGVLIENQQISFNYLNELDQFSGEEQGLNSILKFAQDKLNVKVSSEFENFKLEAKVSYLKSVLNRPIRVCGMVKNEGEPGGGPFWTKNQSGQVSLQIVESAQIDLNRPSQAKIVEQATHFNPVDLVCGTKNYKGEKFNLLDFVDYKAGFITHKSVEGRPVKALELPGLWNGSMSNWNTIFVEVPLSTFNPVKTVADLLKPGHQIKS
ncbi:MAG: NAD metabolism ATPase/kinase [Bacteroidetes bacterium MedPE-SWsnd-G2]|nr:MAG: NAD metabolism ATPase/kinase [Bacteroidetes bacterium MedPE-SWsnd-G2]